MHSVLKKQSENAVFFQQRDTEIGSSTENCAEKNKSYMRKQIKALIVCFACISCSTVIAQTDADLKNFPKGSGPLEIGKLVANHFIETPHTNFNKPTPPRVITYP